VAGTGIDHQNADEHFATDLLRVVQKSSRESSRLASNNNSQQSAPAVVRSKTFPATASTAAATQPPITDPSDSQPKR